MLVSSVKFGGKATLSLKRQPSLGQSSRNVLGQYLSLIQCEGVGCSGNTELAAMHNDRLPPVGKLDGEAARQQADRYRQAADHAADAAEDLSASIVQLYLHNIVDPVGSIQALQNGA